MIALYTLGWMLLPVAFTYLAIWAMWWPRHAIPYGRIAAMTFIIYTWCMIYSASGSDVFDWIQRL